MCILGKHVILLQHIIVRIDSPAVVNGVPQLLRHYYFGWVRW